MRLRQLDVMRGAAVLLVLGHHMPKRFSEFGSVLGPITAAWARCGWVGVDMFFVLSGFLVAGLLFREHAQHGRIRLLHFLLRRGLKIYPTLYVYLAFTLAVRLALGYTVPPAQIVATSVFLQNYVKPIPYWTHTWSLAIEEHFYLGVGVLLLLLSRRRVPDPFRPLPAACAGVLVVLLGFRFATAALVPYAELTHIFPTHLRIDGLFFGATLSYLYHAHQVALMRFVHRRKPALQIVSWLLLLPCIVLGKEVPFMHTAGNTALSLGFGGLLLTALDGPTVHGPFTDRLAGGLAFIGLYSYGIYVWHSPLRSWMPKLGAAVYGQPLPPALDVGLFMGASLVFGVVMSRLIELPVLRLRDRWVPSRSGLLEERRAVPANAQR